MREKAALLISHRRRTYLEYAHVHIEVNVPSKLSMEQVVQLFKSHSSSKVFTEMPNFIKRYPQKSFWGGQPTGTSVGPVGENVISDYIRRQDVSYEPFMPLKKSLDNST